MASLTYWFDAAASPWISVRNPGIQSENGNFYWPFQAANTSVLGTERRNPHGKQAYYLVVMTYFIIIVLEDFNHSMYMRWGYKRPAPKHPDAEKLKMIFLDQCDEVLSTTHRLTSRQ